MLLLLAATATSRESAAATSEELTEYVISIEVELWTTCLLACSLSFHSLFTVLIINFSLF
jgi:hypothetical protein